MEKLLQLVAGTRVGRGEKGNKIKEKKTDPYLEETWKKRGSVVSLNANLDMAPTTFDYVAHDNKC